MLLGGSASIIGGLFAWHSYSGEEANDLAERLSQNKINGAKKKVDLHLHPDAKNLITIIRQRHLDLFEQRHQDIVLNPLTKKVQDDVAVIIEDLHARFGLHSVVCEGLNEKGRDADVEAFKEDITMLQTLQITDEASFAATMPLLEDPELRAVLSRAQQFENIMQNLERVKKEVRRAGSFDRWKKQVIEHAEGLAQEYCGAKRIAAKGVVRLLPGEHSSITKEIVLAMFQRRSKQEIDALIYGKRENHAFSQAISAKEKHSAIVYGRLHQWEDDADAHNTQNPDQAVSLALVTPENLPT